MPAWPATLPQRPLIEGFSEQPPNLVVRSQTDTGPAKVRRRATAGPTRMTLAFRMTADQLTAFRAFLHADLADRALSYSWTHPVTGQPGTFRIVDPPSWEPMGLAWRVGLTLEMLP